MIIKITTELGIEIEMSDVIRILRVDPEYISVSEQHPGHPEAYHRIYLDDFTGRLVSIEIVEV